MSSTYGSLTDASGVPQFTGDDLAAYAVTPAAQRSAALVICDHATGPDDARLLLEACGLAPYAHGPFVSYSYGRRS
jgi:hypothetical protein